MSGKIGIYTNGNSGEAPIGFLGRYGIVTSSTDTFVLTLTYTVPDPADALIELAAVRSTFYGDPHVSPVSERCSSLCRTPDQIIVCLLSL